MGKGTIISEYGAGKYLVSINYDRERLDALLASIDEQIATLSADIAELTLAEDVAMAALSTAGTDLDIAIIFYTSDPSKTNKRAVETATTRKNSAINALDDALAATATAELRKAALEKRDTGLRNAIPDSDPEVDAWCADLNEGLVGEIGLIEPGRIVGDKTPIINPAGTDGDLAAYDRAKDGAMLSPAVMSPEASFHNNAILAGANKWKPRYRKGVITAKDGDDKCTVSFAAYPITSTSQDLDVNQASGVEATIEYMNCNGMVFEVGDHVVVAFMNQSWGDPVVIGFISNPKACNYHGFLLSANSTNYNIVDDTGWSARPTTETKYGGIDWRGPGNEVLTWKGNSRYNQNEDALGRVIYRHGKVLKVIPSGVILGAAISGSKLFYVVAFDVDTDDLGGGSYAYTIKEQYFFADLDDLDNPRLALEKIWDSYNVEHTTPWLISKDGTNGTTTKVIVTTYGGIQTRVRFNASFVSESVTITVSTAAWTRKETNSEVATRPASITKAVLTGERLRDDTEIFMLEDYLGNTLITGEIEDKAWTTENIVEEATLWGPGGYCYGDEISENGTYWWQHTYTISVEGDELEQINLLSHKRTSVLDSLLRTTTPDPSEMYSRVVWVKFLDIRSKTMAYEARLQLSSVTKPWKFWSVAAVPGFGNYDDLLLAVDHGTVRFEWESVVIIDGVKISTGGQLSSGHEFLWREDYGIFISPPLPPTESIYHYCLRNCPIDVAGTVSTSMGEHNMTYNASTVLDRSGAVNVNDYSETIDGYDAGWSGPRYAYVYGSRRYLDEFKWQIGIGHNAVFWEESADCGWYPENPLKILVSTREGFWARTPTAYCLTPGLGDLLTWSGAGEPYTALITDGNIDDLVADSPRINIGVA